MKEGYFSKKIVQWYHESHRDLPWRNTQDAYKIWLSEIILQQTRVAQGLPYYQKFIQQYPDVRSLARAKEQDVLRLWQGLGYYTRARNLHKCAQEVVTKFGGKFPQTFEELKQLSGIGDYTAAAIASFAFHQPVAVVDGNVYRVLSRVFGIEKDVATPEGRKFFFKKANELISTTDPATHNQAVMEFGAMHCLPQNPKCEDCVFSKACVANLNALQSVLPVKSKKLKIRKRYMHYFIIRHGGKTLMKMREEKDIWKGLYDFHLIEKKRTHKIENLLEENDPLSNYHPATDRKPVKHILSHQHLIVKFIEIDIPSEKEFIRIGKTLGLKSYSLKAVEDLPKPILIERLLNSK
ncbi:MAG: A/G-specific adenine glycosylase [Cyclobacteriaceae bacterium]|nr:A/G-specific adenine glycosylase [Cyclobacteriaceae bacterium]